MENKLRAFDEKTKVMHYNFQFIKSGNEDNDWIVFISDKQTLNDKVSPFKNPFFSKQLIIMQGTNIKDRFGKYVYEKDVLMDEQGRTWIVFDTGNGLAIRREYETTYAIWEACADAQTASFINGSCAVIKNTVEIPEEIIKK